MFGEKDILNIVRLIQFIISWLICYSVWKYLNQKPLGMQTVFDGTLKDMIVAYYVLWVVTTFATVKFVDEYDKALAFDIAWFRYYILWVFFWQLAMTMIIR